MSERTPAPAVAVVVPTYNRAASLERLLHSIADAASPDGGAEVVVVDDGSSDDTAGVAAKAGVRYLRQSNAGPAAARQTGWQSAQASRIIFIDDDCTVDREALRTLAEALEGADGVGATIVPMDRRKVVADFMHAEGLANHRVEGGRIRWLATAAVAFRRDALEEVEGFDTHFERASGEDVDLTLRLLAAGRRLRIEPRAIVHHDHRSGLRQLVSTYYRHGRTNRQLVNRHPAVRDDNHRIALQRLSPAAWWRTYRDYRTIASAPRSLAFVALRAAMLIPFAAGAAIGERRRLASLP